MYCSMYVSVLVCITCMYCMHTAVVACRSQPSVAATTTPLAKRENYSKEELLAVFDKLTSVNV